MFLTRAEIGQLTGRVRYGAQLRWLCANGFESLRDADGRPLVLRAAIDARMGATLPAPVHSRGNSGRSPNWNALNAPRKKSRE